MCAGGISSPKRVHFFPFYTLFCVSGRNINLIEASFSVRRSGVVVLAIYCCTWVLFFFVCVGYCTVIFGVYLLDRPRPAPDRWARRWRRSWSSCVRKGATRASPERCAPTVTPTAAPPVAAATTAAATTTTMTFCQSSGSIKFRSRILCIDVDRSE